MKDRLRDVTLDTPQHTSALAVQIARWLEPGDVVLLEGDIGAGKTHFARALIQSILLEPEDVPSPTFTLVQTYDTLQGEVWHADLYRLSGPDQVIELGLEDAFSHAICLVEWPDRLGDLQPESALRMVFTTRSDGIRDLRLSWSDAKWDHKTKELAA